MLTEDLEWEDCFLMEHIYLQTVMLTREGSTWSTLNKATTSYCLRVFPGDSGGNESACNARDLGSILGLGIPWRRAWQPTPVFFPGESPWTEESGGLQSMGSQRVRHNWVTKHSTACRVSLSANFTQLLEQVANIND